MGIDHLYASTEEAKQMLRDALRDPPGRETVIRSSHQRRMSGPLSRLVNYPGWIGQHTREEAEGALENGTRVRKIGSRPREGHQDGALATVLGSVIAPWGPGYGYFVEWDDRPREAVFIASDRLTTNIGDCSCTSWTRRSLATS
jgi:hypothetical protein